MSLDLPVTTMNCQSCGSSGMQERCPRCGQEAWRGRITMRRAFRDLFDAVTDLDGRLPRTFIDLILRPGTVGRDQIEGRTIRHVSPLRYLLLAAATVTILTLMIGAGRIEHFIAPLPSTRPVGPDPASMPASLADINEALQQWYQVLLIAIVPIQAAMSWLLFERARLHLAEHLMFNAHVVAQQTLFYLPFLPVIVAGPHGGLIASLTYAVVSFTYMAWAYADFFRGSFPGTFLRTLLVAFLSYLGYFGGLTLALVLWIGWRALANG